MTDHAAPTVQCESCGDRVPEPEAATRTVPGATLAFCEECAEPARSVKFGVGR